MIADSSFDIKNYTVQEKIGTGSFGKVYKVKEKKSGSIFAAKISLSDIEDYSESVIRDISREVNIISKLNHPSVLKFIGFSKRNFKNKLKPVIITEYSQNGSLDDLIQLARDTNSTSILNDTLKIIIIYGIASAMSYLHSHDIIHRDLKPANILLGDYYYPKIADFGLSKINNSDHDNNWVKSTIGTIKGSPKYIAPEIWTNAEYTKAGDVYAFAIIVYEIMTNDIPFKNFYLFDIPLKINKGYRPEFKKEIPESYKKLIEKCWSQKPNDRPTFDQIVEELKNDESFITEFVNKNDYFNYIRFINEYETTYDASSIIIHPSQFFDNLSGTFNRKVNQPFKINDILNAKFKIIPYKYYIKLDDNSKKIANELENDTENYFTTGKYLIELPNPFNNNVEIGIYFLKQSIKNGCKDALLYYCNMLIKGKVIPKNLMKAKKIIDKCLAKDDLNYTFLKGKIYKNEKNYKDALNCFEESVRNGNNNAIYELGKMHLKGCGLPINRDEAMSYFKRAADNGNAQAMYQYGIELIKQNKNEEGNEYIKQSANKDYLKALYEYSKILEEFYDNKFESTIYLSKAAQRGYEKAMYKYGIELSQSQNPNDHSNALLYLQNSSKNCNIDAIYRYSKLLFMQDGLDYKNKKANMLMKIAANSGNTDAMILYAHFLTFYINKGINVEEDPLKYFKMAAEIGGPKEWNIYALMISLNDPKEAIKYFEMAIEKGNTDAMINYASMLTNGNGIEVNKEKAEELIKMAIEKGNPKAYNEYGNFLMLNKGIDKDDIIQIYKMGIDKGDTKSMISYAMMILVDDNSLNKEEGIKLLKMAIDKGDACALVKYANVLEKGIGIEANKEEAIKYYKIGIEKGNFLAKADYAKMILQDNIEEALELFQSSIDNGWSTNDLVNYACSIHDDFQKSIKLYKMAADRGNLKGCLQYGLMLYNGNGCIVNKKEGLEYIKMSADKGFVPAMSCYGGILLYDNDIPSTENLNSLSSALSALESFIHYFLQKPNNKAEGVKYIKMAADRGDIKAMCKMVDCLYNGIGTKVNKKEAAKYLKILADKGNQLSVHTYAILLLEGTGVRSIKSEAEKYFRKAANEYGNVDSMKFLGLMLNEGNGIHKNSTEAEKYYKLAIEKGDSDSMYLYGLMLAEGDGIPFNKDEAIKYFQMALKKGNDKASLLQKLIDILSKQGYLISPDTKEKVETYKRNIQKGDVDSMFNYGKMLIGNNEYWPLNKAEGVKLIKMALDRGNEEAVMQYSYLLYNGIGIDENINDAIKYLKLLIEKGNSLAMLNYANILIDGQKVPKNVEEAIKYFKMAIEKGNTDAIYSLAQIYDDGIKANTEIAIKYYKMAYEKGNLEGAQRIGQLYEYGIGIEKNMQEAAIYYKIAADGGLCPSMCAYAKMLMYGDGVDVNKKEARKYLQKAIDCGYPMASTLINIFDHLSVDSPVV